MAAAVARIGKSRRLFIYTSDSFSVVLGTRSLSIVPAPSEIGRVRRTDGYHQYIVSLSLSRVPYASQIRFRVLRSTAKPLDISIPRIMAFEQNKSDIKLDQRYISSSAYRRPRIPLARGSMDKSAIHFLLSVFYAGSLS